MADGIGLVWFRRDLRCDDNPAWAAATAAHTRVNALFVLDEQLLGRAGRFRRRQLLADLHALDDSLSERGGRLLVRRGDPATVVAAEARRLDATVAYWNRDVTPYAVARDSAVRSALGIAAVTPYGHLVLPPGSVLTGKGTVSRVFAAFHTGWRATTWDRWPEPGDAVIGDEVGDELPWPDAEPPRPPGEDGAHATLERFLDGSAGRYRTRPDRLADPVTSELSVALHFGTISPRRIIEAVGDTDPASAAFVRQLAWRDWFAHLRSETPTLRDRPARAEYEHIAWRDDPADLAAWRDGRTGYPIVDAGLRQLSATGLLHNRLRMITASFLVKDLLIDWRVGERHFRHLLADGDVAQNVGNWQWVAGTGPDAAPYFRVLNPVTQSRAHDPSGEYLRRWVPELAALGDTAIHAPWELSPSELAAADIRLGTTYPTPIVDHADARERALHAYRAARSSPAGP